MDDTEDVIVVDDVESETPYSEAVPDIGTYETQPATIPTPSASTPTTGPQLRGSARIRNNSAATAASAAANAPPRPDPSHARSAPRPKGPINVKVKFKLSEKATAQAPSMSFLGQYDRELDSDPDEPLCFEEQFILRMPPGEDCEKLRKMVQARDVTNDVWFKFKDSRRGQFHIGDNTYSTKLVDLPCIIEGQKTLDNKQMFKVADICQMLVVEPQDNSGAPRSNSLEEYIWPHGVTPPLHWARKRRFRKRINKRTIESVEQEVERLLDADMMADKVEYVVLDNVNPDLSDSEFLEREDGGMDALDHEAVDAPTPDIGTQYDEDEDESGDEGDGGIDEELAAELDLALGDGGDEDGDDEDEDDESEEEEEDEEEDEDVSQARKLLNEEIRDLEAAVAKKNKEITSSANPLIRKRFEDALKKLTADLEMKLAQREEMDEVQRLEKEGIVLEPSQDSDEESVEAPKEDADDERPPSPMEIG